MTPGDSSRLSQVGRTLRLACCCCGEGDSEADSHLLVNLTAGCIVAGDSWLCSVRELVAPAVYRWGSVAWADTTHTSQLASVVGLHQRDMLVV